MDEKLLNRNKNINRGYRKLNIWIEAIELFVFVKKELNILTNLSFKVKAQIEDSVLSVSSNIAEGYSRRSIKVNIQHINYALGSLSENYSQVTALFLADEIERKWFDKYDNMHYSLENKLINFNKKMVQKVKNDDDWKNDYIIREIIETYETI